MSNATHVSCIRIGGISIIPPVMTVKRKEECRLFREKAIEIENRLHRTRLEKIKTDASDKGRLKASLCTSLEMQIAVNVINESIQNYEESNPAEKHSLFKNLTTETIDVSEYNQNGVHNIITNQAENEEKSHEINDSHTSIRSKLVRSNSYTLENPSEVLLAHLEKNFSVKSTNSSSSFSDCLDYSELREDGTSTKINTSENIESLSLEMPKIIITEDISLKSPSEFKEILDQLPRTEKNAREIMETIETEVAMHQNNIETIQTSLDLHDENQSELLDDNDPDECIENTINQPIFNKRFLSKVYYYSEQEWAASVICAGAKGYLTRRLFATEKVQNLIDTIKDALICAVQLHSAEVIEEADVELHRRLIQQVSAACFAFHDIFFALDRKEQLQIISKDRQRRLEKAKKAKDLLKVIPNSVRLVKLAKT